MGGGSSKQKKQVTETANDDGATVAAGIVSADGSDPATSAAADTVV